MLSTIQAPPFHLLYYYKKKRSTCIFKNWRPRGSAHLRMRHLLQSSNLAWLLLWFNDTHRERLVFHSIQYRNGWLAASDLFHMFTQSIKGTSTDIKKAVFLKVLFMWSSMPIFNFTGYTLTELFRKPDNWRQIYKERVRLFIHQTMMCREETIISTS